MEIYFNIRYEFDRNEVWYAIDKQIAKRMASYICVCDGVILNNANHNTEYLKIINGGMFSICDSGYVPLYLKWLYGIDRKQYAGSDIFIDAINKKKYNMYFLGASSNILGGLKIEISKKDPRIKNMTFDALPFMSVEDFDYPSIAKRINESGAEIIWVAMGTPKQEIFMSKLLPYLSSGVMIAVGAVFNFYSGVGVRRAPKWMVDAHLEFFYRIMSEPKKQIKRCWGIISTLPSLLYNEKNEREKVIIKDIK